MIKRDITETIYEYDKEGKLIKKTVTEKDAVEINTSINPGSELVATVKALATSLGGVQEKTVTNLATVTAKNIDEQETNSITHIIEADPTKSNSVVGSVYI